MVIERVNVTGDFSVVPSRSTCGTSLDPHQGCLIGLEFTPTAPGLRYGSLQIQDNATNNPQDVELIGRGVQGVLGVHRHWRGFGKVAIKTPSVAKAISIINRNPVPFTVQSIQSDNSDFTTDGACVGVIGPKQVCTFHVTFTPASAGHVAGYIEIIDNGAHSPKWIKAAGKGG